MDLKQLQYFVEYCKDRNFSQAARRLYITPQGLNKAVHQLEDEIQIPLLVPFSNRKELTVYGEYLLKHGSDIINQVNVMLADLERMYHSMQQEICVNLSNTIRSIVPVPLQIEFAEAFPNIQINTKKYHDMEAEQKMISGELDVAMLAGPLDAHIFRSVRLFEVPFTLIMHKSHRLASKKYLTLGELQHESIIMTNEKYKSYHNFQSVCKKHNLTFDNTHYVDDALDIYYYCRSNTNNVGFLIGYLPQLFNDSKVCYVPLNDPRMMMSIEIATLRKRYQHSAVDAYVDFIKNYDFSSHLKY